MNISNEKLNRLIEVSRLYYQQNKTQNEIAKLYQVSRPLISRMLKEAKDYGIVNIEIRSPLEWNSQTACLLQKLYQIQGVVLVPDSGQSNQTNDRIAEAAIRYMTELKQHRYGIGWGHIIGNTIRYMEQSKPASGFATQICPLLGNSEVGNRNYHSNELVRIFSLQTGARPEYLYAPALVSSRQELNLIKELENFKSIDSAWHHLDAALVNIGNYPSVPDFASAARYGDMLAKKKAVGRVLGYFYDIDGQIFHSDTDYMLQIPLETLAQTRHVIGICSSNTKPEALLGALRSGVINHLIAPESIVKAAVNFQKQF